MEMVERLSFLSALEDEFFMSEPILFFSNRLERLYEYLRELLFEKSKGAFVRRMLVVPHQEMKSWLSFRLARDPRQGIFMGVETIFLHHITAKLREKGIKRSDRREKKTVSFLELCFSLEVEIRRVFSLYAQMNFEEKKIWDPLFSYLKAEGISLKERRLLELCERLSVLFLQYGKWGDGLLSEWECKGADDWQGRLFLSLFGEEGNRIAFLKELNGSYESEKKRGDIQIHLFAPDFFSKAHHRFFSKLGEHIEVCYYALSPCQVFWSDIRSDREAKRIQSFWKKKGVSEENRETLEGYLRDRNSLLANLGKMGREFFSSLQEGNPKIIEHYEISSEAATFPPYKEFLYDDIQLFSSERASLLECVQADILLLRNPLSAEPISLNAMDKSIQAHVSFSRFREVQALYDCIAEIVSTHSKDKDPIAPGDILALVPSMKDYEGYIRMIFADEKSLFHYRLLDESFLTKSSLCHGFLLLLNLYRGRWDAASLFQLFENPQFRRKHQLGFEDIQLFRNWVRETEICWGMDSSHREEILKRDFCFDGMAEKGEAATWEKGIGRLLMGFSMEEGELEGGKECALEDIPGGSVDFSQSHLLSKFIFLLRSLKEDLRILEEDARLSLEKWGEYLFCLLDGYFSKDSSSDYERIARKIQSIKELHIDFPEEEFSFSSVFKRLERSLKQEKADGSQGNMQAVCFAEMKSLRAVPSKVICLLGLEEGVFPRLKKGDPLNLLKSGELQNYFPLPTDEDRYLFLECLLSSRQYFVMSYVEGASSDGSQRLPSPLLTDLLTYLDEAYLLGEKKPSFACMKRHPSLPFHHSYFDEENSEGKNFSLHYYQAARAYYNGEKRAEHAFISGIFSGEGFDLKVPEPSSDDVAVDIYDLSKAVSNPWKVYFNEYLGMYLEEEREWKNEEDFILSFLRSSIIKKEALFTSTEGVLRKFERAGSLPLGVFKDLACRRVEEEVVAWRENLSKMGVDRDKAYHIEMREDCGKPLRLSNGDWILPPLKIERVKGGNIHIIGEIPFVSAKGLLIFSGESMESVFKSWPLFLAFQSVIETTEGLEAEKNLLFVKDGKKKESSFTDPLSLLHSLADYYFVCRENLSLLIPEWLEFIWKGCPLGLRKKMQEGLKGEGALSYNEYFKWVMNGESRLFREEALDIWKDFAQSLFGELAASWIPKMGGKREKGL